jgi:Mrp family chromosome partitioning ATPase
VTATGAAPSPRLHVVTGKGGTGKTTVATALALGLAGPGRRVLLCEVEGRQGVARLLGTEELPYAETEVAEGAGGGQVVALAVEPRAALLEYLDTFYRLGRAGRALERVGAVDFIATVAPGLRDVLLIGKVYEAVRRTTGAGAPTYDAVVLDAPPTGRITRFLGIGEELATLAGGGPVAGQSASVAALLRSPATAVHVATLLEELPVAETVEAVAELRAAGLPVGAVVADRVLAPAPPLPDPAAMAEALAVAGLDAALAGGLLAEAGAHRARVAAQGAHLAALAALGVPVRQLPALGGGVDLEGLYSLADLLAGGLP